MLTGFDHVNVKTANLDTMIAWYEDVLGLTSGTRPDFGSPGAWMYLGDQAIVHLVAYEDQPINTDPQLEHFAIRAKGLTEFLARMETKGVEVEIGVVPGFGITQVNIWDPDGNHIHIDFKEQVDA